MLDFDDEEFWRKSSFSSDKRTLRYAKKTFYLLRNNFSVEVKSTGPIEAHFIKNSDSIVFETSGTTGLPKTRVHNFKNFKAATRRLSLFLNSSSPINTISCLPINHIAGWMQVMRPWFTGGSVIFMHYRDFIRRFTKELTNRFVSLVPTQLYELIGSRSACDNLRMCRGIFLGGAPCNPQLLELARNEELPIFLSYGMTETAGMITVLETEDFFKGRDGVGKAMPEVSLQLDSDNCILVKCNSLAEPNDKTMNVESGWYNTADVGQCSKDEYWEISYRMDGIINTGGEKVSPDLVESVISTYPRVDACTVTGKFDPKWGSKVIAYVSPEDCDMNSLKDFLRQRLKEYEMPKEIIAVKKIHKEDMLE